MADNENREGTTKPDEDSHLAAQRDAWTREQESLKRRLVLYDDFPWKLGPSKDSNEEESSVDINASDGQEFLQLVAGVDLSFDKRDANRACASLVVMKMDTMTVLYEDFHVVQLTMPYIPGFLAFRECPVLLMLLVKLAQQHPDLYPQLLMVDGNGILHPRGFGLACHLGVQADIPSIGIGKNLYHLDGLADAVKDLQSRSVLHGGDSVPLIGNSGQIWGEALRSYEGCIKPIFVSVGHRISLATAVEVVRRFCIYRVPEPVRQVDGNFRCTVHIKKGWLMDDSEPSFSAILPAEKPTVENVRLPSTARSNTGPIDA